MKVKEISTTANIALSPKYVTPIYIACGTSAQQIDPSASSVANLKIYDLNLGHPTLDTKLASSIEFPSRFHKLVWGSTDEGCGIIAGGCENGSIYLHSASKLLDKQESLVASMENKHSGPVYSLEFNSHQSKLLASGSSESEIFIWDVSKPESPMTPGSKINVTANVTCVSWNRQVEHIMAATYSDRCVVYDLRKNSSIIHISESVSRMKSRNICWHPSVATQLILSSDDDTTPVAQVWDLRYATAPMKTLSGHQRGILATSWCSQDEDLFITTGKDNRIVVWNPNVEKNGEIVGEFPVYNQWSFDMDWSNHDPSLVATSSVDGTVSVYSLLGGGLPPTQTDKFSAIADSFPGMEIPSVMPQAADAQPIQLKNPPKWFATPAGANFAFGGRLVSWDNTSKAVTISQVVTEPELVERSTQLETAIYHQDLAPYCHNKALAASIQSEQTLWQFIGATFTGEVVRDQYMGLLGYNRDQVAAKVRPVQDNEISPEVLADKMASLGNNEGSSSSLDPSEQFEMIASAHSLDKTPEPEPVGLESESVASTPVMLDVGDDTEGLIRHALLVGDYESAVELCLQQGNHSHAIVLAIHHSQELYYKTRDKVLDSVGSDGLSPLIGSVVRHDLSSLALTCNLDTWKEALVAILTYATNDEFAYLAESLGKRLESEGTTSNLHSAMICYVCAGALEKFVSCWLTCQPNTCPSADASAPSELQDLVEIIMVLEKGLLSSGRTVNISENVIVSQQLCQYASILAAQGALNTAASYLGSATQGEMVTLRDRVYQALGHQAGSSVTPAVQQSVRSVSAATGRPRTISTASTASLQHGHNTQYHRTTSTPQPTYQPQQFTPSVQTQQSAVYGPTRSSSSHPPNMFNPSTSAPTLPGPPPINTFPQGQQQQQQQQQQQIGYGQPQTFMGAPVPQPSVPPPPTVTQPTPVSPPMRMPGTSPITRQPLASQPMIPQQQQQQQQQQALNYGMAAMTPMTPAQPTLGPPPPTGGGIAGLRRGDGIPNNRYVNEDHLATNPATQLSGMFNHNQPPTPQSPGGITSFNPSTPTTPYNPTSPSTPYNPGPPTTPSYNPGQPTTPYNMFSPINSSTVPTMPSSSPYPDHLQLQQQQQQQQQQQHTPTAPPAAYDPSVPRGWNDPPLLVGSRKVKLQQQQQHTQEPLQPIMNPVQGPTISEPPVQQFSGFQGFQGAPGGETSMATAATAAAAQPIEKGPVPAEHQVIQDVLNGIRDRGLLAVVHNQMAKQRLEILGPKIEVLYDKLRAGQVTTSTLGGLHEIVGAVKQGDYHRALQLHTATVASGNFSEMSQYMPPLKMLLTTCMQSQIYL